MSAGANRGMHYVQIPERAKSSQFVVILVVWTFNHISVEGPLKHLNVLSSVWAQRLSAPRGG